MSTQPSRQPDHAVEPIFVDRWSTRAFSGEAIPDDILLRGFEAARWAPSGSNAQPWRFIYAKRDGAGWKRIFDVLNERNQVWAANASALILVLSRRFKEVDGKQQEQRTHSFDAGAAWSNLAHQFKLLGWSTRAMGGFKQDAARSAFAVPDSYALEVVIAVGKPADNAVLPEALRDQNQPNGRLPLEQIVAEGRFAFN